MSGTVRFISSSACSDGTSGVLKCLTVRAASKVNESPVCFSYLMSCEYVLMQKFHTILLLLCSNWVNRAFFPSKI